MGALLLVRTYTSRHFSMAFQILLPNLSRVHIYMCMLTLTSKLLDKNRSTRIDDPTLHVIFDLSIQYSVFLSTGHIAIRLNSFAVNTLDFQIRIIELKKNELISHESRENIHALFQ